MQDSEDVALPKVPDHPLIPAGDPELLTSQDEVTGLIEHVREAGAFAYDTEFIGELSYFPRLCVIQIATAERLALIDPLMEIDLGDLWTLVADPEVRTLVHAGAQDLEPVARFLGRAPANVFDVQIAAGFVGQPYPISLGKLVQEVIGVKLGKRLTFTQWDHRPLSLKHQRYAADDVRYLPAVEADIRERLAGLGHDGWAVAECNDLCQAALDRGDLETQYLRVSGAQNLDARRLTILRELVAVRDELAREHDMPPKTMMKDQILVRLARDGVKSVQQMSDIRGMPRPIVQHHGTMILEAVARGRELPPVQRPKVIRAEETAAERVKVDSLMSVVGSYCHSRSVDPGLVMTRADMLAFYRRTQRGESPLKARMMRSWRADLLGPMLPAFLEGKIDLTLRWTDGLEADAHDPGGIKGV